MKERKWVQVTPPGPRPVPRFMHTSVAWSSANSVERGILVFGGEMQTPGQRHDHLNDLWMCVNFLMMLLLLLTPRVVFRYVPAAGAWRHVQKTGCKPHTTGVIKDPVSVTAIVSIAVVGVALLGGTLIG